MYEQEFQQIELEMIRLQKNFNSGMRDLNDQYQALKKKVADNGENR